MSNIKTEKKTSVWKIVILCLFIAALIFAESLLLPSLISSSFINKNTAGYMVFDVEMENWLQKQEYSWIDIDETYKEHVNQEYSEQLSDIVISTYGKSYYVESVAELLAENTGTDVEDIIDVWQNSKLASYFNEFVQMQAGHLVGDNIPPTPKMEDIDKNVTYAIVLLENDEITTWYETHKVEFLSSIKDAMMNSNDRFSSTILETDPVFGESCLILKVLNLLILFYTCLAIVVILTFFIFTALKTKYTWYALAIANLVATLISVFTYFGLSDVNLVVFGISYSPTVEMVYDCGYIAIILVTAFLCFAGICIFMQKKSPRKIKNSVINDKKH